MSETIHSRLIVLGSGPAGLTAAIYAARAGLQPIVIQGIQPGGQLTITTDVENYPGFADVIQGPWLMEEMQAQAEHVGTRMVWDHISAVDLKSRPIRLTGDSGTQYFADSLIIATGAAPARRPWRTPTTAPASAASLVIAIQSQQPTQSLQPTLPRDAASGFEVGKRAEGQQDFVAHLRRVGVRRRGRSSRPRERHRHRKSQPPGRA